MAGKNFSLPQKVGLKMIDWEKEREQYAGCREQCYLLSAAVGLISKNVLKAYTDQLTGLYEFGEIHPIKTLEMLGQTRQLAADYLQAASREEIAFVPNASHGMNVIASLMRERDGLEGEILMPIDEFPSSTSPWHHQGFQVKKVKTQELLSHIGPHTRAVVTSSVQFTTGYRAPLVNLGQVLAQKKVPFIVNATQGLGVFATPVQDAKISALTGSCHKWFGAGYGTALLYLSKSFSNGLKPPFAGWMSLENPFLMSNANTTLTQAAWVHETGTLPFATIAGVKASFENIARLGLHQISTRILETSKYLEERLREKKIDILSARDNHADPTQSINSGILSISFADAEGMAKSLAEKKIYVSARRGFLRIATHYYNNKADIDLLMKHL